MYDPLNTAPFGLVIVHIDPWTSDKDYQASPPRLLTGAHTAKIIKGRRAEFDFSDAGMSAP